MPHPGAQPSRETSAYSTRFQPASESTPACVCLSLPEAATEACPYHHPSSAHLLYLSAGTLPSIHSSPFGERTRWKGRKKKDKASQKIYRKWLLMLRSSRSDLQWEHPGVSWEAQIQYHSFSWLGALCNPINRFLWKPQTLWWAIKAYLHSVPLKGSEAPERSCVWSDISVSLHSLLCCHDLGYTIKKKQQEHGHESSGTTLITSLIYVNYHFFLCLFSQHTILWLFIATVAAPHKTTLCVITYS